MKCFLDGSSCPQNSSKKNFSLREMIGYCKYCHRVTNDNREFIYFLEQLGVNENWWVEDSLIPEDLQENVLNIADDVLSQGSLLKKFIVKEAGRFLFQLSNCGNNIQIRKIFNENWWWLEQIMPASFSTSQPNVFFTCGTLVKLFREAEEIINWNSGDFFTSGIEEVDELFKKIQKISE